MIDFPMPQKTRSRFDFYPQILAKTQSFVPNGTPRCEGMTNDSAKLGRSQSEQDERLAIFRGSRVPIKNLFDCIEEGETIDQFLDQFPTVSREQVNGILELCMERLLESEVAA
jgi:uncharacterized protein (DUF433 family)